MTTPQLENSDDLSQTSVRVTDQLSESTIDVLCNYFGVTSLDSEEVKDMDNIYRKYNKNPSPKDIFTVGSKHFYHNLYRIYIENTRPKFRRYVITTPYTFISVSLHENKNTLIIAHTHKGARNTAKMVVLPEEICIVHYSFSFDMETLFVDVAYMHNSTSLPDTIIMTIESMVEKEKRG
jgi:hypothetical protein